MESNTPQDTVSQSEIERLLAEVGGGELAAAEGDPPVSHAASGELVQRHEFPQLSLFSQTEMRRLRVRHEEFIANLAARLSVHLGFEVAVQMAKLETQSFKAFTDGLGNPTHLTIFRLEPLQGNCVLDVPLRLALSLVDRELGGLGFWSGEPRELTRIETKLLGNVVDDVLSEWCGVWRQLLELRPTQIAVETNSRFLEVCPPASTILILELEIRFGQLVETMHLALPSVLLEPLLLKINASEEKTKKPTAIQTVSTPKWNLAFDDMELEVLAELPGVTMVANDLAKLKPGDLIPLSNDIANQVKLIFEGMPKFSGVLGTDNGRLAVKIVTTLRR